MAGGGSSFFSQLPQPRGSLEPTFSALSRWESRLMRAQLQLVVAVATNLLSPSPQGGARGHPGRSADGSRVSRDAQTDTADKDLLEAKGVLAG